MGLKRVHSSDPQLLDFVEYWFSFLDKALDQRTPYYVVFLQPATEDKISLRLTGPSWLQLISASWDAAEA